MAEIVCLGEALIDFVSIEPEVSLVEAPAFAKAAGGAPANVACAAAKLGAHSAFIGKVGDDQFGQFLEKTFSDAGADTSRMLFDPVYKTGLAFVALLPGGVPDFTFYRNPSADMMLHESDLDLAFLASAKAFHHGSISLISEPSRSATFAAIEAAKSTGAIISYDPNLRQSLWESEESAKEGLFQGMAHANLLKLSLEELIFLTCETDLDVAADQILDQNPDLKLIVVTMGSDGCWYKNAKASAAVPAFAVDVVDTTGAGDAFAAAVLVELLARNVAVDKLSQLDEGMLTEICRFANAVGALTTTTKGAIAALPTREEAEAFARSTIQA